MDDYELRKNRQAGHSAKESLRRSGGDEFNPYQVAHAESISAGSRPADSWSRASPSNVTPEQSSAMGAVLAVLILGAMFVSFLGWLFGAAISAIQVLLSLILPITFAIGAVGWLWAASTCNQSKAAGPTGAVRSRADFDGIYGQSVILFVMSAPISWVLMVTGVPVIELPFARLAVETGTPWLDAVTASILIATLAMAMAQPLLRWLMLRVCDAFERLIKAGTTRWRLSGFRLFLLAMAPVTALAVAVGPALWDGVRFSIEPWLVFGWVALLGILDAFGGTSLARSHGWGLRIGSTQDLADDREIKKAMYWANKAEMEHLDPAEIAHRETRLAAFKAAMAELASAEEGLEVYKKRMKEILSPDAYHEYFLETNKAKPKKTRDLTTNAELVERARAVEAVLGIEPYSGKALMEQTIKGLRLPKVSLSKRNKILVHLWLRSKEPGTPADVKDLVARYADQHVDRFDDLRTGETDVFRVPKDVAFNAPGYRRRRLSS